MHALLSKPNVMYSTLVQINVNKLFFRLVHLLYLLIQLTKTERIFQKCFRQQNFTRVRLEHQPNANQRILTIDFFFLTVWWWHKNKLLRIKILPEIFFLLQRRKMHDYRYTCSSFLELSDFLLGQKNVFHLMNFSQGQTHLCLLV